MKFQQIPSFLGLSLAVVFFLAACAGPASQSGRLALPSSRMVEISDLAQVSDFAREMANEWGPGNVLVVFDLDNTLLAMEQGLGSDQWYDWQKALQADEPCSPDVVPDRLAAQGALYFASAMRPTQPDAAVLVRALQDEGLSVIVLTSRGPDFRLQTFRELRRNEYSFYASAIGPPGGYPNVFVPEGGSRPARYEDGVFLTAGQDKGVMLQDLLARTGTPAPEIIIMADDKAGNLQAVLDAFAGSATSVQAFRYGGEDSLVAGFDPGEAANEWSEVEPLLRGLQDAFGPDNFDLPAVIERPECP